MRGISPDDFYFLCQASISLRKGDLLSWRDEESDLKRVENFDVVIEVTLKMKKPEKS